MRQNPLVDGAQMERGPPDPVGERRAVEPHALTRVDLRLAIKRQVIGVFGNQHVRHHRLGRQAALDEARRRRRLDDDILAAAAGVFRPAHDEHVELRGNDVELLAHVLADPVQRPLAARTRLVLDVDEHLDAGQMRRQGAAVGAPLARSLRAGGRRLGFGLGRRLRLALLDVFERKQQLIVRQALGAAAEAVALQILYDLNKPLCAPALGDQHRLQRLRVVGKRLGGLRHVPKTP